MKPNMTTNKNNNIRQPKDKDTCFNCGGSSYYAKDCPSRNNKTKPNFVGFNGSSETETDSDNTDDHEHANFIYYNVDVNDASNYECSSNSNYSNNEDSKD